MIMLTTFEKREFVRRRGDLTQRIFQDESESLLLFKVLVNFLDKTNVNKLNFSELQESILENNEQVQSYLNDILEYMANIASEESDFAPTYTTGQLAKYFGVSITTINNWINEGRFIGVNRDETNKQVRISANTLYKSRNGKQYPVSRYVQTYENEQAEPEGNLYDTNESLFIINQLALYEEKYHGEFTKTLGEKSLDEMTPEERTDMSTWKYFLRRQESLNVYGNSQN
nr:helix-turn-helix domain-containing protein [Aquibacillus saliphilus]